MAGKYSSKIFVAAAALTALGLLGCGSDLSYANPGLGGGSTEALFYTVDGTNNTVLEFHGNGTAAPTSLGSLDLPSGYNATLLATDTTGRLYVGGYTTNVSAAEVLVYAGGASGGATPQRTVTLQNGQLTALATDATGQIYAAQQGVSPVINVYAATASGTSSPALSITPTNLLYINDVALDTAGNIYVSGYNGGVYLISVFSASTAAAIRTITAGVGSYFGGIALDAAGDLYVMEQLTIVEFAPGASGTPLPINSINLPGATAPFTTEAYSNVLRLDSAGNLNVPTTMADSSSSLNVIFVFSPTATGNANPIVQFTPTGATNSTPLGINIPLAVY